MTSFPQNISQYELCSVEVFGLVETEYLAQDIALIAQQGDVIAISGKLGAGKSTFCRELIRTLAANDALEVPSPTFTLVQQYKLDRFPVVHIDLYRVSNKDELIELGFEDFIQNSLVLIEWPERAETYLPSESLWISIGSEDSEVNRKIDFFGEKQIWQSRLNRTLQVRNFLIESGWGLAKRRFLEGDASTRSYETIQVNSRNVVLMNAQPPLPMEEAIRDGKTYSEIAHLSQSLDSFIAVDHALKRVGVRVPEIYNFDKSSGFMLLENLGNEPVVKKDKPIEERYLVAVEVLAFLHKVNWTREIVTGPNTQHQLPIYDNAAMLIEVEMFLDWYVPHLLKQKVSNETRKKFIDVWTQLIQELKNTEKSIVLRDYHSPNLLWQDDATDIDQVGLIDFQDAVFGPSMYDLVSLVQDARVDIEKSLQQRLTHHYLNLRSKQGTEINETEFTKDFAILASQRATKILGIFARLSERDGKHNYLKHIPRIVGYLTENFNHQSLVELKNLFKNEHWFDNVTSSK